ncbi:hypothetical protein D0869_15104 [Hortaea werneckii]|uniref:Uncharacterized protein n=1 Tax=Hortaea werneckii TaxID=91943 RepID=A0A3M6W0A6_HORWE|nr:hypothetical protein D0869_15104 [Hortaea werneckii]
MATPPQPWSLRPGLLDFFSIATGARSTVNKRVIASMRLVHGCHAVVVSRGSEGVTGEVYQSDSKARADHGPGTII